MSQASENPDASTEVIKWQKGQLIARLDDEGAPDLANTLRRCGEEIGLTCRHCGSHSTGHAQCKQRWCPSCARSISARRLKRFANGAERMRWPLSIMLSHRNEDHAQDVFSTLMPAFKRFRKTLLWKNNVHGGLVSYEVTNRQGTWHDHLHVLCDCRWLALKTPQWKKNDTAAQGRAKLKAAKHELSEAWAKCLGQEQAVTWVDRASAGRLVEHVKYVIKADDLIKCNGAIAPLIRALKGRRLVQPFGTLYGMAKQWKAEDDAAHPPCACEKCRTVGSVVPDMVIEMARKKKEHRAKVHEMDKRQWAKRVAAAADERVRPNKAREERRRYEAAMADHNNATDIPY